MGRDRSFSGGPSAEAIAAIQANFKQNPAQVDIFGGVFFHQKRGWNIRSTYKISGKCLLELRNRTKI